MDNLRNQIGALELGDHPASFDDGVLEISSDGVFAGVTQNFCYPTKLGCGKFPPHQPGISDGALEAAATNAAGPSVQVGCPTQLRCVSDGVLEAAAYVGPMSPTQYNTTCGIGCGRVGDGALEKAGALVPPITQGTCPTKLMYCH
jgi:hypothetical protein